MYVNGALYLIDSNVSWLAPPAAVTVVVGVPIVPPAGIHPLDETVKVLAPLASNPLDVT